MALIITFAWVCHFRATEVRFYTGALPLPILSYSSFWSFFSILNITKRSQKTSQWNPLEEPPALTWFSLLGNVWLLLCLCERHVLIWQVRVLIMITFIIFLTICTYWLSHRLSDLCDVVWLFFETVEHLLDAKWTCWHFPCSWSKWHFILQKKSFLIKASLLQCQHLLTTYTKLIQIQLKKLYVVVATCMQISKRWWKPCCLICLKLH